MNQMNEKSLDDVQNEVAYDATISLRQANVIALSVLPVAYFLFFLPFRKIWPDKTLFPQDSLSLLNWLLIILVVFGGVIIHEGLHALGFIYVGKISKSAVKFGVSWKALAPYAHCTVPLTASAYKISILLPGLSLGLLPGLIGVLSGIGWLVWWGAAMTVAAGGDLAVLLAVLTVKGNVLVRDHPSKAGCQVLKENETKNISE